MGKKLVSISLICSILLSGVFLGLVLNRYCISRVTVVGDSMESTYSSGDTMIISKRAKLSNGDIVVVLNDNGRKIIKRVVASPEDSIKISGGNVIVNGSVLKEDYVKDKDYVGGIADSELTLREDEYFVLGDNRNNSRDSRVIGPIKSKDIIGKCIFNIW